MSSDSNSVSPTTSTTSQFTVALVGAPNAGKTTLYNWLTNSKFKTVNYPGATVEYALGLSAESLSEPRFHVMDTPGTYSLFPKSSDEEVTLHALYNQHGTGRVDKVLLVLDGTQLERHLLLAQQLSAAGFSLVIAITMADLLRRSHLRLQLSVLTKELGVQVVLFDGLHGHGLKEIAQALRTAPARLPKELTPWTTAETAVRQETAQNWAQSVYGSKDTPNELRTIYDLTVKLDSFLLSPVLGLFLFLAIMTVLFSSIFWVAKPFMDLVDGAFGWLGQQALNLGPGTLWADFIGHGLINSIGAIAVFIPQIFILFFGIGILEGTGYLARAATLIDKPFSLIGLTGRSFVPVLSGFACAVPALMATRNISSARDRLITNFIIPLMTCSARLPVYALLLSFVYRDQPAWKPGLALALLYLGSLLVGAVVAAILNRIIAKKKTGFFMMELPLYRKPQWRVLLKHSLSRTQNYAVKAGPMILVFAVLIWTGTTFPNYQAPTPAEKIQTSYFARVGHLMEPVFKPMGVDWRVGVGLMSAFAAREVFVSSMAVVFNVTAEEGEGQTKGLLQEMEHSTDSEGHKLFTFGSVMGLIVFFMLAMQCMSTFAVAVRENRSWKIPLVQLVGFNIVAYVAAVAVFQIFS